MEQRDVNPPVDVAKEQREPVPRPDPVIEPRWLDIDTAAKYLCMTRHALYHQTIGNISGVCGVSGQRKIRSRTLGPLPARLGTSP